MRPVQQSIGATGPSGWIRMDSNQAPFDVGFRCAVGPTGSMTYKVEHAFCDMLPQTDVTLARTTTTATLTFRSITDGNGVVTAAQGHGLVVGDSVLVSGVGVPFDGQYTVATVPTVTSITYMVLNTGLSSNALACTEVWRLYVGTNSGVTGATASTDGNYAFPVEFVRANVTVWASGTLTFTVNQGAR